MSEGKQGVNRFVQTYRRAGQILFVDGGGLVGCVQCVDGVPEELNAAYSKAISEAIIKYGKAVGVYR